MIKIDIEKIENGGVQIYKNIQIFKSLGYYFLKITHGGVIFQRPKNIKRKTIKGLQEYINNNLIIKKNK